MTRSWGAGVPSRPSDPLAHHRKDHVVAPGAACLNTRDIGGIPLAGGLRTVSGLIYRTAASHTRIPPLVKVLSGNSAGGPVVHFFELRSAGEWEGESVRRDTVILHHHPLLDPDRRRVRPEDRGPQYFADQYVRMLPAAGAVLGHLLTVLADGTGPVVVGCRLGKDRTGLLVLLLLRLLGAADHHNCQEFGRTGREFAARPDWLAEYASRRGETAAQVLRWTSWPAAPRAPSMSNGCSTSTPPCCGVPVGG